MKKLLGLSLSLSILLATCGLCGQNQSVVAYVAPGTNSSLQGALALSDGTFVISGTANDLAWLDASVPVTEIPNPGINAAGGSQIPFLLHVANDFSEILAVAKLPAGTAGDLRQLRTTNIPGQTTGELYVSGKCSGGHFIGRLNDNFLNGVPTAFDWAINVPSGNDHDEIQAWDVGPDGEVVYVHGDEFNPQVRFLGADGTPRVLPNLRASHMVDGNRVQDVGVNVPDATESRMYTLSDFQSWTMTDQEMIFDDANGGIKKGKYPLDLVLGVYSYNGSMWGYTGYRASNRLRFGGVAIDRRTGDFYLGFNVQTRFYDKAHGHDVGGYNHVPDFEPVVAAYDADGEIKWYSHLYHVAYDNNGDGQITHIPYDDSPDWQAWWNTVGQFNETRLSQPDQYVDGLAIDYSDSVATDGTLVVGARCHGNHVENLWDGNEVELDPNNGSFHNRFTGTEGNIHISWIGKFDLDQGVIYRATYLAGFFRKIISGKGKWPTQTYGDPNLDGWPSHNAGWPDLTTTRTEPNTITTDLDGNVYISGMGPRMVTTANAWQKTPKRLGQNNPIIDEGTCPWHNFVRVYETNLDTLVYSSAIAPVWTYPNNDPDADPEGVGTWTEALGIAPTDRGLLAVGRHEQKNGVTRGNPMKLNNIPGWATGVPQGQTAYIAALSIEDNHSPTPSWGIVESPVYAGAPVAFSGGASSDPDGDEVADYVWNFGDGKLGEGLGTRHIFSSPGTYDVWLIATDEHGSEARVEQQVTVMSSPVALDDFATWIAGFPQIPVEQRTVLGNWDGDDFNHGQEFLLMLSPVDRDSRSGVFTLRTGVDALEVEHALRKDLTGLTWRFEANETFGSEGWVPIDPLTDEAILSESADSAVQEVTLPYGDRDRGQLRLRILD